MLYMIHLTFCFEFLVHSCVAEKQAAMVGTGPPILNGRTYLRGRHVDATPVFNWDKVETLVCGLLFPFYYSLYYSVYYSVYHM